MTTLRTFPSVMTPFLRPIAHRGLHDVAAGVIENTTPAFQAAIAGGYGIECDVRSTADGVPIVFHDATLARLVDGQAGRLDSLEWGTIAKLTHRQGGAGITTLADLVALVNGAVPLLVELKTDWEAINPTFLDGIAEIVSHYRGPLALMSFDPAAIRPFVSKLPANPRGLVSGSYATAAQQWWPQALTAERARSLAALTQMEAVDASFCAYEINALPTPHTDALRARGIPVFAWTVRTPAERTHAATHADAIIFEHFPLAPSASMGRGSG